MSDVGDVNGFFTLMKQTREIGFSDQLRQLVVGAVVRGGERGKSSGIAPRCVSNGRHQLPPAIDEQRTKRFRLTKKAAQRFSYCGEVVLSDRPGGRAGSHRAPVTALIRGA